MSTALLLLAYGAPESLGEVPDFLYHMRGGRPVAPELVEEIIDRYRQIGGGSPLPTITRRLVDRLTTQLDIPVYMAMRHWSPFIAEVTAQMAADGVRHIKAICLTPHYSEISVGAYRRALEEAIAASGQPISFDFQESWEDNDAYISGVAHNVKLALDRFKPEERKQVVVAFTAHSLPKRIGTGNDIYSQQLEHTAQLVAHTLGIADDTWFIAYQSVGRSGGEWMGPSIEERLLEIAAKGQQHLLVAPIGFVCDNLEILYDIDISLQQMATDHRIHMERTPMLNDSNWMVSVLSSLALTSDTPSPRGKP
jgi:protoporphyrin/coproporphyrin ferrochelatase